MGAVTAVVERCRTRIEPDHNLVIPRYLATREADRIRQVVQRVTALPAESKRELLKSIRADFERRHDDFERSILASFDAVLAHLGGEDVLTHEERLVVGAYFSMEYTFASSGLFNPSIIRHPQPGPAGDGGQRVLISLRAVGEGHISSIAFREGWIGAAGDVRLDPIVDPMHTCEATGPVYYSTQDLHRLENDGIWTEQWMAAALATLPAKFTADQFTQWIESAGIDGHDLAARLTSRLLQIPPCEYSLRFASDGPLSCRVIFPVSKHEALGMEDLRMVETDGEYGGRYVGTYTAYNGVDYWPQLLITDDFRTFQVRRIHGPFIRDKGLALFPRRVSGKLAMVSRHDGESLYLLLSDDGLHWNDARLIRQPRWTWELYKTGNCGSPIELDEGWLLLTHGVGPMRRYSIGAVLLDKGDPTRVLAETPEPILSPLESERGGYVPNVVYTCGAMLHGDRLVMPYAISDRVTGFAMMTVSDVLGAMVPGAGGDLVIDPAVVQTDLSGPVLSGA